MGTYAEALRNIVTESMFRDPSLGRCLLNLETVLVRAGTEDNLALRMTQTSKAGKDVRQDDRVEVANVRGWNISFFCKSSKLFSQALT